MIAPACCHCGGSGIEPYPEKMPLTKAEKRVLDAIHDSFRVQGVAPSLSEIARYCEYRSLATAHELLENLKRKGWITRAFKQQRGITVKP